MEIEDYNIIVTKSKKFLLLLSGMGFDISMLTSKTASAYTQTERGFEPDSGSFHSASAFMWYETSNVWGNTWHYLDFGETKPTTSDSARTFKIDLGGPVFRIGLKFGL